MMMVCILDVDMHATVLIAMSLGIATKLCWQMHVRWPCAACVMTALCCNDTDRHSAERPTTKHEALDAKAAHYISCYWLCWSQHTRWVIPRTVVCGANIPYSH